MASENRRLTTRSVTAAKSKRSGQYDMWDSDVVPGFGLRVGKRGRKTFNVMVRIHGKQKRINVGTFPTMTLAEARAAARQIKSDAEAGIDPTERKRKAKAEAERRERYTFAAVAADFVEHYVNAKQLRTGGEIEATIERELIPEWGHRPVRDISRRDVKELIRVKAAEAPVAANRLLAVIRKFFNWALDEEIIDASPAARITPPSPEVERERVLTDDELAAIWKAGDEIGYPFGPLYRLLLATAQRRAEVAKARWSEIDMDAQTWTISGMRSKSGRGHVLPLSSLAMEVLGSLPRVGDHVIVSSKTGGPVSGFSKAKRRCDELSGVTDWRVHDLRRTAATKMRSLGVERLTVSKVLNHEESGVTKVYDRYAADPEKRQALERWGEELRRIVEGRKAGKVVNLRGGSLSA